MIAVSLDPRVLMSRTILAVVRHSFTFTSVVPNQMLRHAPESQAAPLVLNVAAPHQSHLGDDESAEARLASLREEVASKLEVYGAWWVRTSPIT